MKQCGRGSWSCGAACRSSGSTSPGRRRTWRQSRGAPAPGTCTPAWLCGHPRGWYLHQFLVTFSPVFQRQAGSSFSFGDHSPLQSENDKFFPPRELNVNIHFLWAFSPLFLPFFAYIYLFTFLLSFIFLSFYSTLGEFTWRSS
jgi:hypothetical protein